MLVFLSSTLLVDDPRDRRVKDSGECVPLFSHTERFADSVNIRSRARASPRPTAASLQALGLTCYQPLFGFLPEPRCVNPLFATPEIFQVTESFSLIFSRNCRTLKKIIVSK